MSQTFLEKRTRTKDGSRWDYWWAASTGSSHQTYSGSPGKENVDHPKRGAFFIQIQHPLCARLCPQRFKHKSSKRRN